MDKVFVDSSAWIALFIPNDTHHKHAVNIYNRLAHTQSLLFTSDYVFDETITTLLKRVGPTKSRFVGESLLNSRLLRMVHMDSNDFQAAWILYKKYADKNFSFTDITSLVLMKRMNIGHILSFDAEYQKVGVGVFS